MQRRSANPENGSAPLDARAISGAEQLSEVAQAPRPIGSDGMGDGLDGLHDGRVGVLTRQWPNHSS
jgi:hypothetical protein